MATARSDGRAGAPAKAAEAPAKRGEARPPVGARRSNPGAAGAPGNQAVGRMIAGEGGPFGRGAARAAVGRAIAGRYPFGDRIAAETGGRVDPHRVPSVVVDRLPGLGVCHDGRVALRRGAGIEVARHELAHALGGDERIADRAARDPRVLGHLGRRGGPPVDGWAVGFEFQTTGGNNPTVMVPDGDDQWKVADKVAFGANAPMFVGPTYKIEQDHHDIEVIIEPPVPETAAGRKQLAAIMDDVSAHMAAIQAGGTGKHGYYTNLDEERRQGKDPDAAFDRVLKLPRVRAQKARAAYDKAFARKKGKASSDASDASFEKDPDLVRLDKLARKADKSLETARALAMRRHLQWGVRVRANPFKAHPQATMGIRYEQVTPLLERLSKPETSKRHSDPSKGIGWGDHSAYKRKGAKATRDAIDAVRKALGKLADQPDYARLQGMLTQLSTYFHVGRVATKKVTYIKDVAPFMARTDMIPWVAALSEQERSLLAEMVSGDDPRLAQAFGAESRAALAEMKLAPKGAKDAAKAALGPIEILAGLLADEPTDLIGKGAAEGLHIYGPETGKSLPGMADHGDIGVGVDGPRPESGMIGEFRRIRQAVPWTQWKQVALAVFDTTVLTNEGPEALAKIRGPVKRKPIIVPPLGGLAPPPGVVPAPLPGVVPAPLPGVVPAPLPGQAPLPMAPPMPGKAPLPSQVPPPVAPRRGVADDRDLDPLRERMLRYFNDPDALDRVVGALQRADVPRSKIEIAGLNRVARVFAAAVEHVMDLDRLAGSFAAGGHLWRYLARTARDEAALDAAIEPMVGEDDGQRTITASPVLRDAYIHDLVRSEAFLSEVEGHTLALRWNTYARVFRREASPVGPQLYVDPFTRQRFREVRQTRADGHCLIHGLNMILHGQNASRHRIRAARRLIGDHLDPAALDVQLGDMVAAYIDGDHVPGLGPQTLAVLEADASVQQARIAALYAVAAEPESSADVSSDGKSGDDSKGGESDKGKAEDAGKGASEKGKSGAGSGAPRMERQDVRAMTDQGYGVIVPAGSYGDPGAPAERHGVLVFVNDDHYIVLEPIDAAAEPFVPLAPGPDGGDAKGGHPEASAPDKGDPAPKKAAPKKAAPKKSAPAPKGSKAPLAGRRLQRGVALWDVESEGTRRNVERIVRVHMPRAVFGDRHERAAFLAEWTARILHTEAALVQRAEQEGFAGAESRRLSEHVRRAIRLVHRD